jgi:hypothetical protein
MVQIQNEYVIVFGELYHCNPKQWGLAKVKFSAGFRLRDLVRSFLGLTQFIQINPRHHQQH